MKSERCYKGAMKIAQFLSLQLWSWRNIPPFCLHFCYMRFFSLTMNHHPKTIPSSCDLQVIGNDHKALQGLPWLPGTILPGLRAYLPLPGMSFSHLYLHLFKSCSFFQPVFKCLYPSCSHSWILLPTSGYLLALPWYLMNGIWFIVLFRLFITFCLVLYTVVICISILSLTHLSPPGKHGYYLSLYLKQDQARSTHNNIFWINAPIWSYIGLQRVSIYVI